MLSIPSATASVKLIEHKWPVTFSPALCASSIAAASSLVRIVVYALSHVAPSAAQYRTNRRACSAFRNRVMISRLSSPVM